MNARYLEAPYTHHIHIFIVILVAIVLFPQLDT